MEKINGQCSIDEKSEELDLSEEDLAPVVLFAFNRPEHTKLTLDALGENYLASKTKLFVYVDGPRSSKDVDNVNKVIDLVRAVRSFKETNLVLSETNKGLAASITNGVTKIVNQYGKIIVVEDDLITSKSFLTYVNNALVKYKNNQRVFHISGWNYPIDMNQINEDAYFWRGMNCWGWATWKDRWQYFNKDKDNLFHEYKMKWLWRWRFDVGGVAKFWRQIRLNHLGHINTWAVYWYASIFKNGGVCLNPVVSQVRNIGFDGSGVHCNSDRNRIEKCTEFEFKNWPNNVEENKTSVRLIREYYFFEKLKSLRRRLNNIL